jgi:NADPH2:quinone reductase
MQAVGLKAFGGPEVIEVMNVPVPEPGAGQVRVRVLFAGVNAIDVHVRKGNYLGNTGGRPKAPMMLGYEGAGEVEGLGQGVSGLKAGDRVAWCGVPGSLAERAIVPAQRLVTVPANVPLDIACALQLDGALAHALTVSTFPLRAGDWVMVHGAGSTAGLLLIQISKAQGTKVVATTASEAEAEAAKAAGADVVLGAGDGELAGKVGRVTDGQWCNVVFDGHGSASLATSIACCRRRGLIALFSALGGAAGPVLPDDLAAGGSVFLTRVHLPDYMQDAEEVRWRSGDVMGAWQKGQLKVNVARVIGLAEVGEALKLIEAGAVGKILVKMGS